MGLCFAGIAGDCGAKSEAETTLINRSDLSINQDEFNDIQQTCGGTQSSKNSIDISNSNNVKLSDIYMQNSIKNLCTLQTFLKSTRDAKVLNETLNKLDTNQKTKDLLTTSKNNQRLINETKVKVSQDTINRVRSQCLMNVNTDNIIKISQSSNVELSGVKMINEAYNECLSKAMTDVALQAGIDEKKINDIKTSQDTKGSKGILGDLLAGVGDLFSNPGFIIAIVVVVMVLAVLAYMKSGMMSRGR